MNDSNKKIISLVFALCMAMQGCGNNDGNKGNKTLNSQSQKGNENNKDSLALNTKQDAKKLKDKLNKQIQSGSSKAVSTAGVENCLEKLDGCLSSIGESSHSSISKEGGPHFSSQSSESDGPAASTKTSSKSVSSSSGPHKGQNKKTSNSSVSPAAALQEVAGAIGPLANCTSKEKSFVGNMCQEMVKDVCRSDVTSSNLQNWHNVSKGVAKIQGISLTTMCSPVKKLTEASSSSSALKKSSQNKHTQQTKPRKGVNVKTSSEQSNAPPAAASTNSVSKSKRSK